jgi:hypothetical protein
MVDAAARTAAVELPDEVRAFICREITRANAFVHALQLLRAALPQAHLSVKRRAGDRDEPVWLVARGAFDSATVMVDQLEELQAAFRKARGRGWDSSVMLDLRRER